MQDGIRIFKVLLECGFLVGKNGIHAASIQGPILMMTKLTISTKLYLVTHVRDTMKLDLVMNVLFTFVFGWLFAVL